MNKIDFLKDYPKAEKIFKIYAERIQKFSSWIKMRYKNNHTKVEMNRIFPEEQLLRDVVFYLKKLYEYTELANSEGYSPIEIGDISILSGEYQWSTEADFIAKIDDGYLPLIKDGTSEIDAYERAKNTQATGTSSKKVILMIIHQKNSKNEDHKYHKIYKEKGYYFPNKKDEEKSPIIPGGSEWVVGIDPFTKIDIVKSISKNIKSNENVYYPSTPQQRVRDLTVYIDKFIDKDLKNDPDALLKLAVFLKCRAGKTPSFIDLIDLTKIDYCFFISRRVAVAYEVKKNVTDFFQNIMVEPFKKFYKNKHLIMMKTIITTTIQSFEDDNLDFDNELSTLKVELEEIKPYVKGLIGCLVLDEAQIGGITTKMKIFAETVESILGVKIFMDLSGTPSKLYAMKEYDHIVESDLMEENEIRERIYHEYDLDKHIKLGENYWD